MALHHRPGLWKTYYGLLAFILTVVFWSCVTIMAVAFKDFATQSFQSFIFLNLAGVFGLIIAAIRERWGAGKLLTEGFVECQALALKQTVYVGVAVLVVLFAVVESAASRLFEFSWVFSFLLVLYILFLICHLFLLKRLAGQLFSTEKHEGRTLLIGRVDKARKIAKWIEETAAVGISKDRSAINPEDERSAILHVTRLSDPAMLERIIKNDRIERIILLEVPVDRETLSLVVDVGKKSRVRLLVFADFAQISNHDLAPFNLKNNATLILATE